MSDVIRLLPDSVANQIAAGEVIQRPASVIKELVENAIDAGSTTVDIFITDAGRTLIQVVDNGCGMTETDARMAFERHATSKITSAADLFGLRTMGFRGEALASICAVAQVELRTQPHDAAMGTRLVINGSKVETQEPQVCAPGSNMMVKNLFYNVPARRKFLKKDAIELGHIMREFERLALVNPTVQMSISHNGTVLHHLLRGSLKQRITELFGKGLDKQLIAVETETGLVRIAGFVSLPAHARKRNVLQYLFVNGRNMRHPRYHKAIMQCYEGMLAPDAQPNYFLDFTVDPDTIDVNIHPTKNEIKFENEDAIHQILAAAIRESLGRFNASGGIDFDVEDAPDIPLFDPEAASIDSAIDTNTDTGYNPFAVEPEQQELPGTSDGPQTVTRPSRMNGGLRQSKINTSDWEKLFEEFSNSRKEALADVPADEPANVPAKVPVFDGGALPPTADSLCKQTCITLRDRYIISPSGDGLLVIDRHRAHMRVLYEEYAAKATVQQFTSQSVLFPETLELSPSQQAALEGMSDELTQAGFRVESDGNGKVLLSAVPSVLGPLPPAEALLGVLDAWMDSPYNPADEPAQRLAVAMASAAAIRPGQTWSATQTEQLLADLFSLAEPRYTPDGRKVFELLDFAAIGRLLS